MPWSISRAVRWMTSAGCVVAAAFGVLAAEGVVAQGTARARAGDVAARGPLTAMATLSTVGVPVGPVAGAAHTIAALSLSSPGGLGTSGYVFGEPPGGWSAASTPPVITASDGHQLSAIAVSDTIAVAVDGSLSSASPVTAYLFERPAGRWSGNLHEVATLVASGASRYGPAALTPAAIVGRTVFTADGSIVYAFAEPADGWSGTVHPSARLRVGGPRDATDAISASGAM